MNSNEITRVIHLSDRRVSNSANAMHRGTRVRYDILRAEEAIHGEKHPGSLCFLRDHKKQRPERKCVL